jgi:hypothetical protein
MTLEEYCLINKDLKIHDDSVMDLKNLIPDSGRDGIAGGRSELEILGSMYRSGDNRGSPDRIIPGNGLTHNVLFKAPSGQSSGINSFVKTRQLRISSPEDIKIKNRIA